MQLGVEDVPRPLWDYLEDEGDIDEVLDFNRPLDREDLLGMARERFRFAKEMSPFFSGSAGPIPAPRSLGKARVSRETRSVLYEPQIYDPLLDPLAEVAENLLAAGMPVDSGYAGVLAELLDRRQAQRKAQIDAQSDPVIQRAEAFSLYLANLAKEDPKVKNFRREIIDGGAAPSAEEAEAFLFSPATALFTVAWFKENGVPIMGHTAKVLEMERLSSSWPRQLKGTVKVEWDHGEVVSRFDGEILASDPFERVTVGSERVSALKGSTISELLLLDEHLRGRFPWRPLHWDVLQVPMFVLTGKAPWVEPIRVSVPEGYPDLYQTVDITVWPWVPVEKVTSMYERVRKELNPTPTTSPKRLALFIFIMQHPEVKVQSEGEQPSVPSWRELLRLWNKQYPEGNEWYYKDVRNLQRDFKEAYDQVVNFYRSGKWFTKMPPIS